MPFSFVENHGQAPELVRFIGNGPQFKVWFEERGFVLQQGNDTTKVRFDGGLSNPRITPSDPNGANASYFSGSTENWKSGLPLFNTISYGRVWPGIDVVFRTEHSCAKAEYVVSPGVSVERIRLRFDGIPSILSDGSLVVPSSSGEFKEIKPYAYQEVAGVKREIQAAFVLVGIHSVGFTVAPYDTSTPLVIDPPIVFSGYAGGSSQSNITSVAVNSGYQTVVAGWTASSDLPATGGAFPNPGGGVDAFVAAFSPDGGRLLFCTYFGGSGDDRAFGIAVDAFNNTYITGWTSSTNFPVANSFQSKLKGTRDAFVVKLNATGTALVYATYLGGTGVDTGNAISLDSANAAVIVGDTTSASLPVTASAYQSHLAGGQDAFVAKLGASGNTLSFLTYLGGSATDHVTSVKLDATGAICLGGSTYSANFPVVHAAQPRIGGGQDGFLTRMSSSGTSLLVSTYVGGSGGSPGAPEQVNAVAIGHLGNLYVAGVTSSADFPITSVSLQNVYGGGQTDGFLARYDPVSGALQRSTFFGGSQDDSINAIALDYYGYLYFTGYTTSNDIQIKNPVQAANGGGMDIFLAKGNFGTLIFSSFLGGAGNDSANSIAIDSLTNIIIGGSTSSGNYPVVGSLAGSGSVVSSFVSKIGASFSCAVHSGNTFYFDVWHDTGVGATLNMSSFGGSGDLAVTGDWDGTGIKRIGIFHNGTWLLDINGNGIFDSGDRSVIFGQAGDIPVVGDWNGSGRVKLGLYRQGTFILDLSGHLSGVATGLIDATFPFGLPTDIPVASDWNHSGSTKVGVFRNGQWLVDYSGVRAPTSTYTYGQTGDIPVIGDWDSSGLSKIGVYRNGLWILDYGGDNTGAGGPYELYFAFGGAAYLPLVY